MSQKIYSDLDVKGTATVRSIPNATLDTDKFLVSDGGLLKYRTGSEMLFDIGVTSGYVPYTGAISNLNLGEYQLSTGQITFDQTPTQAAGVGVLRWNDVDGTLDLGLKGGNVTLQLGQEQLVRIVNKTASNLTEAGYQAVYTSGAQGQRLKVDLALANSDLTSAGTLGIVTENIDVNQEGFVTTNGLVRNINTTGSLQGETWLDGDILYLSPTIAGRITKIKPIAPQHLVVIGVCVYAHATQGSIFVKVDNGYELEELHNVLLTTPANNEGLFYDSATGLWKNETIVSALGYTPYNATNPSGYTSNIGTVTSVTSGNGLSFTTITGAGAVTLGTPSSTTLSSTNAVTATSHTHAFAPGGTAAQYISGAGTLLTFPTLGTWSTLNYPTWVSGTPFVKMTAAGTFSLDTNTYLTSVTPSNFASQTANMVLAAPDSVNGVPTFRTLTLADLPDAWVKKSVGCATTAELTINTAQTTIDGVTLSATTRVLVKDQAAPAQNGIYTGVTTTTWARALDANVSSELAGACVAVDAGTVNGGLSFDTDFKTTDTLGTTSMTWSRILDRGYLTTVGNSFATLINPSAITFPRINADNTVSTLDAATFRTAIGAGTSTVTPSALTKVDDTNVTLTLGGTPATSLLQGVSLTLGWTGTLADGRIASATTWNSKQAGSTNLTSLSALTFASTSFVKMTALGTFALDTNSYYLSTNPSGYTSNDGTVTSVTAGNGLTQSGTATINPTLNVVSHAGTAGSIGTINVGADAIGVNLGATGITACAGNDARLSDARTPTSGSSFYIQNQTASAQTASMWVSGTGRFGGNITLEADLVGNGNPTLKTIWGGAFSGGVQIKTDGSTVDRYARIGMITGAGVWNGGMTISNDLSATFSSSVKVETIKILNSDADLYGDISLNLDRYLFKNKSGNLQFLTQNDGFVTYKSPTISGTFSNAGLTASRTFTLPDVTGTIPIVSQTITNGVTDKSPSEDAVFDALALKTNIADSELKVNKQNDLTIDGTGTKYPTVDAVNAGLNTKQNALTNPITGTGTAGYVSFWNATSTQIGSSSFFWDNTNKYLGIGTSSPLTQLHVKSAASVGIMRLQGLGDADNYSVLELWDNTGDSKWQFAHKLFAGETKDFSFAHWNGTAWSQPMRLKDSGRILLGVGTVDDGVTTNLVQSGGYIRAAGYRIPSGLATQYLMADGSTTTGGGGGSPAGSDTQIQFNNAGAFGASADFVWNNTLKSLSLLGTDTDIVMKCTTNEPPTPATDTLAIYTKKMGGKAVVKTRDEFGVDLSLQTSFWDNNVVMWNCTSATAGLWLGTVGATAGTFANTLPTSGGLSASIKRALYSNVVTTTNQALGVYGSENLFMRGPVAAFGGFYFYSRFTFDVWTNGGRLFTGLSAVGSPTNIVTSNPSTATNIHTCGFAVDSTDNGVVYFITNDGTTTTRQLVSGMPAITSAKAYDAYIYCAPGGSTIYWRLEELSTNTTISGSQTLTLPSNSTTMKPYCMASNAALTPVNSIRLGVNKIYLETDY